MFLKNLEIKCKDFKKTMAIFTNSKIKLCAIYIEKK